MTENERRELEAPLARMKGPAPEAKVVGEAKEQKIVVGKRNITFDPGAPGRFVLGTERR